MPAPYALRFVNGPDGLSAPEVAKLQPLVMDYAREVALETATASDEDKLRLTARALHRQFQRPDFNALVVYRDAEPVGFVQYRLVERQTAIALLHAYLQPAHRDQGVLANWLLPTLAAVAQSYGYDKLETTKLLDSGKVWFERTALKLAAEPVGDLRVFRGVVVQTRSAAGGKPYHVIHLPKKTQTNALK